MAAQAILLIIVAGLCGGVVISLVRVHMGTESDSQRVYQCMFFENTWHPSQVLALCCLLLLTAPNFCVLFLAQIWLGIMRYFAGLMAWLTLILGELTLTPALLMLARACQIPLIPNSSCACLTQSILC